VKWAEFVAYCAQDTETLRDIRRRLPAWPNPAEREAFIADQLINDAGLPIDVPMARAAFEAAEANAALQVQEVKDITGVANPGSLPQMTDWLESRGVTVPNLTKDSVVVMLEDPDLDPDARRVLELRQELALVASKKYTAALDRVNDDGRLRGALQFFGAHTGRWAGRGVQFQNLPSATLGSKDMTGPQVDREIAGAVLDLKLGSDMDAHTLKALVRAMFVGPFTVVDYASIEARVVSWLAHEAWALQAFDDGRDIYVETAERMGGMTRKEGKVAVLALGYNGGINSLRVMGAEGEDDHLQTMVDQWREANPAIVSMWREMDHAFRNGGPVGGGKLITVEKDGKDRHVVLPSGRAIVYRDLRAHWQLDQWKRKRKVISFADPEKNGGRTYTYGGKLTENVTQAVARDVLAEAMVRLQSHGMEVVGHVHDEVLVLGSHSVERVSDIMTESPAWAAGLPISAEGFVCPRYRKD
jgi:DNA polymerase bacteriophage-type